MTDSANKSRLRNMTLKSYLKSRGESEAGFARRTGVQQKTINRICAGEVRCRIDIANRIVRATHKDPTPSGGTVSFEELIPKKKRASRSA